MTQEYAIVWKTAESRDDYHQVTLFQSEEHMNSWFASRKELAAAMKSSIEMLKFGSIQTEPVYLP